MVGIGKLCAGKARLSKQIVGFWEELLGGDLVRCSVAIATELVGEPSRQSPSRKILDDLVSLALLFFSRAMSDPNEFESLGKSPV